MAQLGDLIFQLAGKPNPRDQLMQAIVGGTSGTPPPAGSTHSAAAGGAGMAAPGAPGAAPVPPPQPQAHQSPPDLMNLYMEVMKRTEQNEALNRGLGMIGASLAQEGNRGAILAATQGGTARSSGMDMLNSLIEFQGQQATLAQKAAQRAALPAIAKQYGLDLATAQYLFDAGELDAVIKEAEKPNKQIIQQEDGTHIIVDLTTGELSQPFGVPKKREVELVDDGKGGKMAVWKDTKEPVGKNDIPGMGATDDQRDYNFYREEEIAAGRTPASFEEWRLRGKKAGASSTNVSVGGEADVLEKELAKESATQYASDFDAARGASNVLFQVNEARRKLDDGIIAGSILSPLELEGRKVWADVFGFEPDADISNTESFQAALRETVLSKIKALGSGTAISDADRKFIEQAVGGNITLTEASMRKIFDILERGANKVIDEYNAAVDELLSSYETEEERKKIERLIRKVKKPEPYKPASASEVEDLLRQYGD